MWKQGLLTANAQYYDDATQEWRSASEIASPIATAFKQAVAEAKRPKTPAETAEQKRFTWKIMLWISVPVGVFFVLLLLLLFTSNPSSSGSRGGGDPAYDATRAGMEAGFADGLADARSGRPKMGSSTRLSAGRLQSSSFSTPASPEYYARGWAEGYEKGYDRYRK